MSAPAPAPAWLARWSAAARRTDPSMARKKKKGAPISPPSCMTLTLIPVFLFAGYCVAQINMPGSDHPEEAMGAVIKLVGLAVGIIVFAMGPQDAFHPCE